MAGEWKFCVENGIQDNQGYFLQRIVMTRQLLIIEGEGANLEGLQSYLDSKGYGVYLVHNVRHGFEVLHSLCIDGVLLSLDMLEMNDLEVLNDLRSGYPKIPVITMSSSPSRKLVLDAFAGGVRGHISKPIAHQQLQEAMFIFEGHLC